VNPWNLLVTAHSPIELLTPVIVDQPPPELSVRCRLPHGCLNFVPCRLPQSHVPQLVSGRCSRGAAEEIHPSSTARSNTAWVSVRFTSLFLQPPHFNLEGSETKQQDIEPWDILQRRNSDFRGGASGHQRDCGSQVRCMLGCAV
jgi:hypothetical protein